MLVIPRSVLRSMLTVLTVTGGTLFGCKVGLFKNDAIPTPTTVLGDLTSATFPGYALGSAVTWGTVFSQADGDAVALGTLQTFAWSGVGAEETIYGYFVTNAAASTLLYAERFPTPVTVAGTGDAVQVLPRFVQSEIS